MVARRKKGRPDLGDFLAAVDSVVEEKEIEENTYSDVTETKASDVRMDKDSDRATDVTEDVVSDRKGDITGDVISDKECDINCDNERDKTRYIKGDVESDIAGVRTVDKASDKTRDITPDSSKNVSQDIASDAESAVSLDIDKDYATEVVNEYMSLYMYELSKKSLLPRQLRTRYVDNHKRITVYFRNDNVSKIESFKKATGLDQSSIINMALDVFFRMLSEKKLVDEIQKRKQ